jgi:hypothetical protein
MFRKYVQEVIATRSECGPGVEVNRCRQHESIVVVGMFADEIYAAGRAEDARLGIKAP